MIEVDDFVLLREEISQLKILLKEKEELIIQLKESLLPSGWLPPIELGLTTHEAVIVACLYKNKGVCITKEHIFNVLYADKLDQPEIRIIDVYICKLRRKLATYGLEVQTVWGRGYLLTHESAKIFDDWDNSLEST